MISLHSVALYLTGFISGNYPPKRKVVNEVNGGAVVNDSPGDCQSRTVTEPAGETGFESRRERQTEEAESPLFTRVFCFFLVSFFLTDFERHSMLVSKNDRFVSKKTEKAEYSGSIFLCSTLLTLLAGITPSC